MCLLCSARTRVKKWPRYLILFPQDLSLHLPPPNLHLHWWLSSFLGWICVIATFLLASNLASFLQSHTTVRQFPKSILKHATFQLTILLWLHFSSDQSQTLCLLTKHSMVWPQPASPTCHSLSLALCSSYEKTLVLFWTHLAFFCLFKKIVVQAIYLLSIYYIPGTKLRVFLNG